jgi:hypothetical protein
MIVRHCSEFRQPAAIMKRRSRRNLLIASAAAVGALLVCNAAAQEGCKLTAIDTANVAAVRDGRTLLLTDGRELRLTGIEVTMTAALRCKPSSTDIRSVSNGSAPSATVMAAWSRSHSLATPSGQCSRPCSSKATRGCRRMWATRPAPTPF